MRRAAASVLALAVLLTGCSQVAAIAPVGGDRLSSVRYAVNDLLVADGTELLTAPVCEAADDGEVTCAGETLDGMPISAVSPASRQDHLSVEVGGRSVYEGSLQKVLSKALEGTL